MNPDPAVSLRDVWFSYDRKPVLREVTLSIQVGEWLSVVGPNGGGKTTLLKLILGLLRPDRGEIRVLGMPVDRARHRIGYTPQHAEFDPQFPVNVRDVVLMGRLGRTAALGSYDRQDHVVAERSLQEVGMARQARESFARLSGGQRQRVLIARALAAEPELLLLDEPTANLDVGAERELYELLRRLQRWLTIVMVSHDIAFVSEHVSRVACVRGRVHVHPTGELTGERMRDLYGMDIRLVRHDHDCLQDCSHD